MAEKEAIAMFINCYRNHESMYVVRSFCEWNNLDYEDIKERALDIIMGLEKI